MAKWKPHTPEQIEKSRAAHREWYRRQREMLPEKIREKASLYREKNRAKVREYHRNWRENASEEMKQHLSDYMKDYSARYYQEHKELLKAKARDNLARNPEQKMEKNRRRGTRIQLRKEPRASRGLQAKSAAEANKQLMLQNKAYAAAFKYVPRNIPREMRDDIISDIIVACLECTIDVEDVKNNIQRFITAHNRSAGFYLSLDAEVGDGLRLIDTITEENLPWS